MLDLVLMIIFDEEKSGVQVIFHQVPHYLQWGQTSSNKILPSLPLRLPTIGNTECSTWFLECQTKIFVNKKKFATFAPAPLFLLSSTWLSSCRQPRWRRRRRTGDRQSCLSWWLRSPTWWWRWWRLWSSTWSWRRCCKDWYQEWMDRDTGKHLKILFGGSRVHRKWSPSICLKSLCVRFLFVEQPRFAFVKQPRLLFDNQHNLYLSNNQDLYLSNDQDLRLC